MKMVASRCCHNNVKVLPCFSLISTGTCSFGRKCLFLHDKRAFIQDLTVRKYLEHQVNGLLHYYRPLTHGKNGGEKRRAQSPNGVPDSWEDLSWQDDGSSCASGASGESRNEWRKLPNLSSMKDESFYYPTVSLSDALPRGAGGNAVESNTGFYNPPMDHDREVEVSMWKHFLSCEPINRVLPREQFHNPFVEKTLVTMKPRLGVFMSLSQGESLKPPGL